jgi:tetratricopeptide (TPR) repeat protein
MSTPRLATALHLAFALGLSSLATGCAHRAGQGGGTFSELRSAHFVMLTDRAPDDAREALLEYESIYRAFTDVVISGDVEGGGPTQIVLFDREADYRPFAPRGADAYFTPRLEHDPEPMPTLVLWGDLIEERRRVFQHELAHHVFHLAIGPAPAWVHEGLAEYYETFRVDDGAAFVGIPNPSYDFYLNPSWDVVQDGATVRLRIPIGHVPKLPDLLSMDRTTFYVRDRAGESTLEEEKERTTHYAGACTLVHMLNHHPKYADGWATVLGELSMGQSFESAWDHAFAGRQDEMATDFHDYLISRERRMARTPYTPKPPEPPRSLRTLSDAETRVLRNRLRSWDGPEEARVRADFDQAIVVAPRSAEARLFRGIFHMEGGRLEEAQKDLEIALAETPEDPRVLVTIVRLCTKGAEEGTRLSLCTEKERAGKILHTLESVASAPTTRSLIARILARAGREDDALVQARRAVKDDPACAGCLDTLAVLLYNRGMMTEAIAVADRELAFLPEKAPSGPLVQRTSNWRRERLAAARAKKDAESVKGDAPTTP